MQSQSPYKRGDVGSHICRSISKEGLQATDPDGISVTLLDSDLPKKLVIVEDLNLYLALQQETLLEDDNVVVEILNDLPRAKRWSF